MCTTPVRAGRTHEWMQGWKETVGTARTSSPRPALPRCTSRPALPPALPCYRPLFLAAARATSRSLLPPALPRRCPDYLAASRAASPRPALPQQGSAGCYLAEYYWPCEYVNITDLCKHALDLVPHVLEQCRPLWRGRCEGCFCSCARVISIWWGCK